MLRLALDTCFERAGRAYDMLLPPLPSKAGVDQGVGVDQGEGQVAPVKPLAALLPETSRLAHMVLNGSPNEYVKVG